MTMSNKVYDILNKIQRWLPALAVFYMALCSIWGFNGHGKEVRDTILAIATLLAATLEISTGKYNAAVLDDVMTSVADALNPKHDEPQHDEPEQVEAE